MAMHGGMEFVMGEPVTLTPPPALVTCGTLRVRCGVRPEVAPGQAVKIGQPLAQPLEHEAAGQGAVISPIHGVVRQITPAPLDERQRGYEVTLEPSDPTAPTVMENEPPLRQRIDAWLTALRRTGPWCEMGLGQSLLEQVEVARTQPIHTVLCVGLDAFPPYPARSSLMMSFSDDAALGTQILSEIVGGKQAVVAVAKHAKVVAAVRRSCAAFGVRMEAVEPMYPLADPTLVAAHVSPTPCRVRAGENPALQGLVLTTPWTVIRLAQWFTMSRLYLVRPVFVGWPTAGVKLSWSWAMPGQTLASLDPSLSGAAATLHGRAIVGHPLSGRMIRSPQEGQTGLPPTVPDDEMVLSVLAGGPEAQAEPCVRCGWCAAVCPTRLLPIDLAQRVVNGRGGWVERSLRWCVGCGLCTHVCPAQIPLAQVLTSAREMVRDKNELKNANPQALSAAAR
jgi:electron transport complex protein RnfC